MSTSEINTMSSLEPQAIRIGVTQLTNRDIVLVTQKIITESHMGTRTIITVTEHFEYSDSIQPIIIIRVKPLWHRVKRVMADFSMAIVTDDQLRVHLNGTGQQAEQCCQINKLFHNR